MTAGILHLISKRIGKLQRKHISFLVRHRDKQAPFLPRGQIRPLHAAAVLPAAPGNLHLPQVRVVEPVFNGKADVLPTRPCLSFQTDRGIGLTHMPELRLFPPPSVEDPPWGSPAPLSLPYLIHTGPDGAAKYSRRIPQLIPEPADRLSPEIAHSGIPSLIRPVITGNVGGFVMKHRPGDRFMAASVETVHQCGGILLPGRIVHAPDIRPVILLPLGDGIAENRQTPRILLMGISIFHGEIPAPEAFICQRPENDAGMGAIPFQQFGKLIHKLPGKFRIIFPAVNFLSQKRDSRFILHINTVFVAQIQEIRTRRIVAGTDKINICFLKQTHILLHQLVGDSPAGNRVDIMPVNPPQLQQIPIQINLAAFPPYLPETNAAGSNFRAGSILHHPGCKRIQIRVLTVPFHRGIYRIGCRKFLSLLQFLLTQQKFLSLRRT